MVIVVNVKSLHMSSTPIVYVVFATVVIIAVDLVSVVVFVLGNFAVLSSFFVVLVVELVIVVPSLMSLSLPFFVLNAFVYGVFIVVLVAICVNFVVSASFFVAPVPLLWS